MTKPDPLSHDAEKEAAVDEATIITDLELPSEIKGGHWKRLGKVKYED